MTIRLGEPAAAPAHPALATLSTGAAIPVSEDIACRCTRDSLQFDPKHGGGQDLFDALVRQVDRIGPGPPLLKPIRIPRTTTQLLS